jgi:hypothetical protein
MGEYTQIALSMLCGQNFEFLNIKPCHMGTAVGGTVVKVLRYNRKVAGSIPGGVIGIFH